MWVEFQIFMSFENKNTLATISQHIYNHVFGINSQKPWFADIGKVKVQSTKKKNPHSKVVHWSDFI